MKGKPILTKFLNPADYICLEEDLRIVDRFPLGENQHTHRRWEYAMCLRAIREWLPSFPDDIMPSVADVGGAKSSLRDVLDSISISSITIDPRETETLRGFRKRFPMLQSPVVTCISTIEHILASEYEGFIEDLAEMVWPGGLLFLTADAQSSAGVDDTHFNWMRQRIYFPATWLNLANAFRSKGFEYLGGVDWTYYGSHVYVDTPKPYSFCCMSLVKEGD